MKAYTDIKQSRKLAQILPIESADFHFSANQSPQGYLEKPICGNPEYADYSAFPCWSLTALLDVFPCSKESPIVNLTRGGWIPSFTRRLFATWEDEDKNVFYSCDGISPVDAVVELILKLHEQNLL